jgi:hypothetical protein
MQRRAVKHQYRRQHWSFRISPAKYIFPWPVEWPTLVGKIRLWKKAKASRLVNIATGQLF